MTTLLGKRFIELGQQLEQLQSSITKAIDGYNGGIYEKLDPEALLNWGTKVKSLLTRMGAEAASHLHEFTAAQSAKGMATVADRMKRMRAVFLAAKEDFEGGYLMSFRNLVQAEVFTSELEQAEELLKSGYATAAAVIAGVVLETTLRDLCTAHELEHGSLNKMNDDLAKAGAYNASQKKRITALAAIRNSAAHGKPEEFTPGDVKGMIDDVERFLTRSFSS
ncbi:DUF4145 domain-containing protein [Pseudomonas protegens]|uniref:DUF4145 domain-containing protein n=1 Tax=Pseudomonas protegens TaxID=380021 RepID=UPI001473B4B8|nr:DUF4145 domain-containing protein [Pseudomonas protegens]NMZ27576.1 DUF4145 domain-containing protein [Pseudomonas protegens]NMZ85602.1 DUF4145 domain-containing protein [Pseudomonas protegens]